MIRFWNYDTKPISLLIMSSYHILSGLAFGWAAFSMLWHKRNPHAQLSRSN